MTPSQISATNRMTKMITRHAKFSDGEQWYNGPVVFTAEVLKRGEVMLVATNCTNEKRWYETSMFILIIIGVRGGVSIRSCEGMITKKLLS